MARLSFVPTVQRTLIRPELEGKHVELAEKILKDNPLYTQKKKKGYVSLIFGNFILGHDQRLLAAKLGHVRELKWPSDYDLTRRVFPDEKTKIFPSVCLLWDRDEQVILIERNTAVFRNYERVLKSIEDHLNNSLTKCELRVFIEPITEKTDFWKAIRLYKYLYAVSFELHMPNFLGKSQEAIKELLEIYRRGYNATSVTSQLSNPDGKLTIPVEDPQTSKSLEWVARGGGSWSMEGFKEGAKRKVKMTSKTGKNMRTIETYMELTNYTAEEVVLILNNARPIYSVNSEDITDKSIKNGDNNNKSYR